MPKRTAVLFIALVLEAITVLSVQLYRAKSEVIRLERRAFNLESYLRICNSVIHINERKLHAKVPYLRSNPHPDSHAAVSDCDRRER